MPKKQRKEIDFLITLNQKVRYLIEVKMSESEPAKAFTHFKKFPSLQAAQCIQLVENLNREKSYPDGTRIFPCAKWLADFVL